MHYHPNPAKPKMKIEYLRHSVHFVFHLSSHILCAQDLISIDRYLIQVKNKVTPISDSKEEMNSS
ncbi:hypothetical protein D1AOALGA4SA_6052 [Olavius algarvensis Delta 1 endosymbiont]|nr:hypothetical protein D1AOALGA4SA_6052 [Olavius algarvensis Delta 1 endosymbiont]